VHVTGEKKDCCEREEKVMIGIETGMLGCGQADAEGIRVTCLSVDDDAGRVLPRQSMLY
jgi:hypothetical protein